MTKDNPVHNLASVEQRIRSYWDDIDLLSRLEAKNEDGEPYFLLDGPPFANNEPHIGHFRNTVYKDIYIRYAQLQGKNTVFKPGFDTHGLPVENAVQQEHDVHSKDDIEAMGEQRFMELCRDHATKYMDEFLNAYELLGSWYAWREPYITYENDYIESVWATFQDMYDDGLVYKGKKPVYWCPVDQTTMAGYEVTDSYETVEDPMVIVKFQLEDRDASLIAYTTTPWTLPSNTFLAVHPDETYVEVSTDDDNIILAEERLDLLDDLDLAYTVEDSFPGSDLAGLSYEPLIDCSLQRELAESDGAHTVYESIQLLKERVSSGEAEKKDTEARDVYEHFVTVDSGTGVVHCAPGHGHSDHEVGQHYNLPLVSPLDDACQYTEDVEPYAGMFVKDADDSIVEDLREQGSLLHTERITHEYPVSWRSEAPLIFRLSDQWFFDAESLKDQMLEQTRDVEWQPGHAEERFANWVRDVEDWNFTRQRYWGVPVPIFENPDDPDDIVVIGSASELRRRADQDIDDDFDLHLADELTITEDNTTYEPIGDVFDVWFDSGNVPYGSTHYPFENEDLFDSHFPVSRINESQDQIRGWFYALMYVASARMDSKPYETVSMTGWVMDKHGDKLSKSKGNFEPVPGLVEDHGADNIRFYYCWDTDPGKEMRFDADTIQSESSEALSTLWNLTEYATQRLDTLDSVDSLDLRPEDTWVLSKAHTTTQAVEQGLESFEIHEAGQRLYDFIVKDLSRGYVQLTRERDDNTPETVLLHCVLHAAKLLAPITPHLSEDIYQSIDDHLGLDKDSVHLERIPTVTEPYKELHDTALEQAMSIARDVIRAGRAARDRLGRGARWPVASLIVDAADNAVQDAVDTFKEAVRRGVNAERIEYDHIRPPSIAEPRYKAIGKDHQEDTQRVASIVEANPEALRDADGAVDIDGFTIQPDYYDLSWDQPDNHAMGEGGGFRVYIAEEQPGRLDRDGMMREVLRRVQVARKERGLDRSDRISLRLATDDDLQAIVAERDEAFKEQAGISDLSFEAPPARPDHDVDGHEFSLEIDDVRR